MSRVTTEQYLDAKTSVCEAGYAAEIRWASSIEPCGGPMEFASEAIWVILNSGMKEQVARGIWTRMQRVLVRGESASTVFGHAGKCSAIDTIWGGMVDLFADFEAADDKVAWCETLPWIGSITKYHLAKNLGVDCCKPDRHLIRMAEWGDETPDQLCARLAAATGDRIAAVDTVLWRAANLGIIETRSAA